MNDELVPVEFAFPGALRDYLLAAIRSGTKTATASLAREYEVGGEPLPVTGQRGTVIDSDGNGSFIIETSEVQIVRLDDVPLDHALAEGEGVRVRCRVAGRAYPVLDVGSYEDGTWRRVRANRRIFGSARTLYCGAVGDSQRDTGPDNLCSVLRIEAIALL